MAKLSVIIPCYNNGKYLKEMMDCCIRQTFKDWELIIVDDQSSDKVTQQIGKEYSEKDKRIQFLVRDREPKGSVVCRNIGFEHSTSEYIIHFDADDLISDSCFEKRVQFMEEHPDCDYASFPAKSFWDGEDIPVWDGKADFGVSKGNDDILYDFLTTNYPFSVWCNIYRRTAIANLPWDENVKIYTDFSFIVPCIFAGLKHQFSNLNEYDYYYRNFKKGNNMCSNFISQDKRESTLYLFNKVINQITKRKDKDILLSKFSTFIQVHFERLLLSNDTKAVDEFIEILTPYYPTLCPKLYCVKNKIINKTKGHYNQARMHFILYKAFGRRFNKIMFFHEIGKWIVRKP